MTRLIWTPDDLLDLLRSTLLAGEHSAPAYSPEYVSGWRDAVCFLAVQTGLHRSLDVPLLPGRASAPPAGPPRLTH